jgi:hypothetical protein
LKYFSIYINKFIVRKAYYGRVKKRAYGVW